MLVGYKRKRRVASEKRVPSHRCPPANQHCQYSSTPWQRQKRNRGFKLAARSATVLWLTNWCLVDKNSGPNNSWTHHLLPCHAPLRGYLFYFIFISLLTSRPTLSSCILPSSCSHCRFICVIGCSFAEADRLAGTSFAVRLKQCIKSIIKPLLLFFCSFADCWMRLLCLCTGLSTVY